MCGWDRVWVREGESESESESCVCVCVCGLFTSVCAYVCVCACLCACGCACMYVTQDTRLESTNTILCSTNTCDYVYLEGVAVCCSVFQCAAVLYQYILYTANYNKRSVSNIYGSFESNEPDVHSKKIQQR